MTRGCKQWAQKRNYAKFRVTGTMRTLVRLSKDSVMTLGEQMELESIARRIGSLLDSWEGLNDRSKKLWMKGR